MRIPKNHSPSVGLSSATRTSSTSVSGPAMRDLSRKDLEGFSSAYDTLARGLGKHGIQPSQTLLVSVGRSPQVLAKYMERRDMNVAYLPLSGLSGKSMKPYESLTEREKQNRDAYFDQALGGLLKGKKAIVTMDVGVSGSSNYETYKEINGWLERKGRADIQTKMATVSPFQQKGPAVIDTRALQHDDNLFKGTPLDTTERGIHRLLKVQYNSIDKELAFTDKFPFADVDAGKRPPALDTRKEAAVGALLDKAIQKYGLAPEPQQRRNPDKDFPSRLLFKHEVDAWQNRQADKFQVEADKQWQAEHPILTGLLKVAHALAAISAPNDMTGALDKKYWKNI